MVVPGKLSRRNRSIIILPSTLSIVFDVVPKARKVIIRQRVCVRLTLQELTHFAYPVYPPLTYAAPDRIQRHGPTK